MKLLIAVLEKYLKNEWANRRYTHLPKILFKTHNLLSIIEIYLLLANDEEFSFYLSKISNLIHFIIMCSDSKNYMITEDEAVPNLEKVFYLIESAVSKKHCANIMKLVHLTIHNWFFVHKRFLPISHKDINKDPLIFQNQIVVLQMIPIANIVETQFKSNWDFDGIDDLRELYFDKIVRALCQYTIRLGYNYRNMILRSGKCSYDIAIDGLQFVEISMKYYQHRTAVIVFQALIYVFNDCNTCLKSDPTQIDTALKQTKFYYLLVKVVEDLIKIFDFTWKDCVESICVVNVALDFLVLTEWPRKVFIIIYN